VTEPHRSATPVYGGIEAGGTKFVCLAGTGPGDVVAEERIPTTTPAETLDRAIGFFRGLRGSGVEIAAVGVASFGPLEVRREHPAYGSIITTTKPGWSHTPVAAPLAAALGVPIGFETDVNGALLGEGRWGAGRGLESFVYMTIGTGIGAGALSGGRIVGGLGHTEIGHVVVRRRPGDDLAGVCPFHRDCLEGLASGPALEARWGARAEDLGAAAAARAVDLEAAYLADGLRNLVYTLAPERIVIGGGVAGLPGLFPALRTALAEALAGYPGHPEHRVSGFVVPAALGGRAGPLGALVLAEQAL
jgi:fructokinase